MVALAQDVNDLINRARPWLAGYGAIVFGTHTLGIFAGLQLQIFLVHHSVVERAYALEVLLA